MCEKAPVKLNNTRQEFVETVRDNEYALLELERAFSKRAGEVNKTDISFSEELLARFLSKHEELISMMQKAHSREEIIENLLPYAPILNNAIDSKLIKSSPRWRFTRDPYPCNYKNKPTAILESQKIEFEDFRKRIVDFLDLLTQTPVGDAIWEEARKENTLRAQNFGK